MGLNSSFSQGCLIAQDPFCLVSLPSTLHHHFKENYSFSIELISFVKDQLTIICESVYGWSICFALFINLSLFVNTLPSWWLQSWLLLQHWLVQVLLLLQTNLRIILSIAIKLLAVFVCQCVESACQVIISD